MRFEPPRIHFTHPALVLPKFNFDIPRLEVALRKLRFKRATRALAVPPPVQLRHAELIEPRPTGFDKYGRRFTREGGIELEYRDVERTLPVILGKISLWLVSCLVTYYAGRAFSPIHGFWWNVFAFVVLVLGFAVFFFRDKKIQRLIEIRPDCMIIEGMDTFWKSNMQVGWPGFIPNDAGHFVLCGVYGSRWIEYLTIRRFDENDRAPELFATQLAAAMTYQWELPSKGV